MGSFNVKHNIMVSLIILILVFILSFISIVFDYKGEIITLGRYEQDNDLSNGAEPIKWVVYKKVDGKTYLVSKDILDVKPFNKIGASDWQNSSIRFFLNEDFYLNAFDEFEKKKIVYNETTKSNVFLLSSKEYSQIFNKKFLLDRINKYSTATSTPYAISKNIYICTNGNSSFIFSDNFFFGHETLFDYVYKSDYCGSVSNERAKTDDPIYGIRPCIIINK